MVELALILTFIFVLVFGMIDFGNTLSDYENLRQGVREAAREATNNPSQFGSATTTTCLALSPIPTTAAECFYRYIVARTGLPSSRLTVTWSNLPGNISTGTPFEVCVNFATQSITGYAQIVLPTTVHADVEMQMEPQTSTFPSPSSPAVAAFSPCG